MWRQKEDAAIRWRTMKPFLHSVASLSLALPLVTGCGPDKTAAHPEDRQGHEHGHEHGDKHEHHDEHHEGGHHPKMEGAIKAFHDVLAPVYHADKGPGRAEKACSATSPMKEAAAKVAGEPKGDPESWKTASSALDQSIADLEASCKGDMSTAESALEKVHDAFHALLEKSKG